MTTCAGAVMLLASIAGQAQVQPANGRYAEDYQYITRNGSWCWFSDPRAIYIGDRIFGGFVDNEGSIWSFSYDPSDYGYKQVKVYDKLDPDDHANPSVMRLPDDRIVIWFSGHGGSKNTPIYYAVTKMPADISEWEELQQITPDIPGQMGYCYTNTAMLSEEGNKIYLFFRGPDFKPDFVTTTDLQQWSEPHGLVRDDTTAAFVRPYLKMTHNGRDKIFFAFTDDHPRNRADNSIYFVMYKGGKYYAADGRVISDDITKPVPTRDADRVYDARKTFDKAWIWDIAFDQNENPVIVYARFSKVAGEHSYWYATWDGEKWNNRLIAKAGLWFNRRDYTKSFFEYECNYSGGVYLDHENPSVLYTSRPFGDIFELERWQTSDAGKTWQTEPVTRDSELDNVRPFVIRGHKPGQPDLLWMYVYNYEHGSEFHTGIRINQAAKADPAAMRKQDILAVGRKAADWQIAHYTDDTPKDWIAATWHKGLFDFAQAAGSEDYFQWLMTHYNRMHWQVGDRMYHADDFCVAQTCLDMYKKYGEEKMLAPTLARADWVIAHPLDGRVAMDYTKSRATDRWTWCDALFMAPPVYTNLYAITGDRKYMKFADREFRACYDSLYDKSERLFYRDIRFKTKREENGAKVFWGRGNGWVAASLVEILKTLPETDKRYRPFYENLLKEMCGRLAGLQGPDGFWHASLLDPQSYPAPEASATGLIVYALAYGINSGLLPQDDYFPVVKRGWEALVSAIDTEGKLGWVQPVGHDPKEVTKKMTALYGVGAFLMAASEIHQMAE